MIFETQVWIVNSKSEDMGIDPQDDLIDAAYDLDKVVQCREFRRGDDDPDWAVDGEMCIIDTVDGRNATISTPYTKFVNIWKAHHNNPHKI